MTDLDPPSPPAAVLVPLDGSTFADRAVPVGHALATLTGGGVHLVGVADGDDADELGRHLEARATALAPAATWELRSGSPAEEIAAAGSGRLVCLASHGRGRLAGAVLGSTAIAVMNLTGQPVVVVGPAVAEVVVGPSARVLACVEGSPESERVLAPARAWAQRLGLPLTVTTVAEPVPASTGEHPRYARRFGPDIDAQAYVDELAATSAGVGDLVDGVALYDAVSVADALSEHLRQRPATLMAVTTRTRTGAARAVLGSVAARIVHESPVPVLLVPVGSSPGAEPDHYQDAPDTQPTEDIR